MRTIISDMGPTPKRQLRTEAPSSPRRVLIHAAAGLIALAVTFCSEAAAPKREPIGHGAIFVKRPACACDSVQKKGIFAHPPWQGAKGRVVGQFDIHLNDAKDPVLTFFMGIQDGHGSDQGLIYRVSAGDKELWSEFWKEGRWQPVRVSLKDFAGKAVKLELAVDSLGEHYANWGEPRILDGEKVLYDLADLAEQAGKFVDLMDSVPAGQMPASIQQARERQTREGLKALPTPGQLAWQEMEFIAFAHFGMNTFTDREWGDGKENPKLFNPTAFDAKQWAAVLKDAGIKMLILTAKHHDGFCLWPSKFTEHGVKNSPWREGKGDVVREVSGALREAGLKFGVYLSPWDRNQPVYGDSPKYNEYFKNQLRELLTNYGPVSEVWFDGACAEGPNGKRQVYDWAGYYSLIRELQPKALIAICGPDIRWVGNESGVARETEWSVQPANPAQHPPGQSMVWWPAECDVSIRPGWFYHASQDKQVKSLAQLLDIYYQSVGRNSVLLLNIPPDRRGLIHENDARRLQELRQVLDETFKVNLARGKAAKATSVRDANSAYAAEKAVDGDSATCWAAGDDAPAPSLEIDLGAAVTFNRSMVQEHIALGQRIEAYALAAWDGQSWRTFAQGTTVGYKKLDRFPEVTASRVRLTILKSRAFPAVQEIGLFQERALK
jgi:alpha-L-fucosidase